MLIRINIHHIITIKITRCGGFKQSTLSLLSRHTTKNGRPATISRYFEAVYSIKLRRGEFTKRRFMAKKQIAMI